MGYLTKDLPPEFQRFPIDVFVSYSHGAFPGQSNTEIRRWSQKLAEDLREELLQFSGVDDLSLFFDSSDRQDESVDPTAMLTDQLRERMEGSALLTLLMSPQYMRSQWCAREREWWTGRNQPDPLSAGGRLFLCRLLPTDEGAWPDALKELVGYFFYDQDKEARRARPFTYRGNQSDLDQYNDALIRLSGDIAQRLKAVRAILEDRHRHWQQQQKAQAESGQIIYLYGRPDVASLWSEACDRLTDDQFVVNPDRPAPMAENGGLDPESRSQLAFSDGLLILGSEDGRAVDSDMVVVGRRYRHLAIEERGSPLPCAVFDTVGGSLQEERRLRNAANMGISWIDGTRTDWSDRLRTWLREAS